MSRWSGSRREEWRWDVLSRTGEYLYPLDNVESGKLDFSIFNAIRGGGDLSYVVPTSGGGEGIPDWNNIMLQPWYTVTFSDGTQESWPFGVFIPSTPGKKHSDAAIKLDISLYDKLLILDQDAFEDAYSVPAGTVVTDRIRDIIYGATQVNDFVAIDASTETVKNDMVWEPGTSKLRVVNDLLSAINYFSLWVDGYGSFRSSKYLSPADRATEWDFKDNWESIYLPDFEDEQDTFDTPNKFVVVSSSDGTTPALVGVATNENPDSPFSYQSRGRWIVQKEQGADATSQAVADAIAARRLVDVTASSRVIKIKHAIVPLDLNDVVAFTRAAVGISTKGTIQSMSVNTVPGSLIETRLSEVAA